MNQEKEVKLEEIKSDFSLEANYIVTKKVSELKTYGELQEYAKARNYKNGWVYYQAKQKQLI